MIYTSYNTLIRVSGARCYQKLRGTAAKIAHLIPVPTRRILYVPYTIPFTFQLSPFFGGFTRYPCDILVLIAAFWTIRMIWRQYDSRGQGYLSVCSFFFLPPGVSKACPSLLSRKGFSIQHSAFPLILYYSRFQHFNISTSSGLGTPTQQRPKQSYVHIISYS